MKEEINETNVAGYDQAHAHALDLLRGAEVFLLAVPHEDEEGNQGIVVTAAGPGLNPFRAAVGAMLNAEAWEEITKFLRRDRYLRWGLITACVVNIVFAVYNMARLAL